MNISLYYSSSFNLDGRTFYLPRIRIDEYGSLHVDTNFSEYLAPHVGRENIKSYNLNYNEVNYIDIFTGTDRSTSPLYFQSVDSICIKVTDIPNRPTNYYEIYWGVRREEYRTFTRLYIRRDYWYDFLYAGVASSTGLPYLNSIKIKKITRCNKDLNAPAILTSPYSDASQDLKWNSLFTYNNTTHMYILARIQSQNRTLNPSAQTISLDLVKFQLWETITIDSEGNTEDRALNINDVVTQIRNIYETEEGLTATVLNIYFCPPSLINIPSSSPPSAPEYKTYKGTVSNRISGLKVSADITEGHFGIAGNGTDTHYEESTGYKRLELPTAFMAVGTRYNYLILPNYATPFVVTYRAEVSEDGLKFIIKVNDDERDLTDALEIPNISNTLETSQERLSRGIQQIAQGAGAVFQLASGTPAGIIGGTASLLQTIINKPKNNGSYQAGGNGITTYNDVINNKSWLYIITNEKWSSAGGTSELAFEANQNIIYKNGAEMDICSLALDNLNNISLRRTYKNDFLSLWLRLQEDGYWLCNESSLFKADKQQDSSYGSLTAYVQADVQCMNMLEDAAVYIENQFANGVYIKFY